MRAPFSASAALSRTALTSIGRPRLLRHGALALCLAALAGCASSPTGGLAEDPAAGRDTVQTDALHQAQGRQTGRAAPQIQLGLGGSGAPPAAGAPAASTGAPAAAAAVAAGLAPRQLAEARTYLGTVPCLAPGGQCPATRLALTLAPNGQWRARTQHIGATTAPAETHHGCWDVTHAEPLRIRLRTNQDASWARLEFAQSHTLRVLALHDRQPSLPAQLTRQAEVDPIDTQSVTLSCR